MCTAIIRRRISRSPAVPCILRWPGVAASDGRSENRLHYQIDVAATVLELMGARVPERWDGRSFASSLTSGAAEGRDHLIVSHAAWTAQRSVRFDDWICVRTYHDGLHGYPEVMLFDVADDPHEQRDLAPGRPDVVDHALSLLHEWQAHAMYRSPTGVDPLWTVIHEGGPWHAKGHFRRYMERLRSTGRSQWADRLEHTRRTEPPRRRAPSPRPLDQAYS